jgi:hypothetical protein
MGLDGIPEPKAERLEQGQVALQVLEDAVDDSSLTPAADDVSEGRRAGVEELEEVREGVQAGRR